MQIHPKYTEDPSLRVKTVTVHPRRGTSGENSATASRWQRRANTVRRQLNETIRKIHEFVWPVKQEKELSVVNRDVTTWKQNTGIKVLL